MSKRRAPQPIEASCRATVFLIGALAKGVVTSIADIVLLIVEKVIWPFLCRTLHGAWQEGQDALSDVLRRSGRGAEELSLRMRSERKQSLQMFRPRLRPLRTLL